MIDPHFFSKSPPLSLGEIAAKIQGECACDPALIITDVAVLCEAQAGHLSFFHNAKFIHDLRNTQASVVILHPKDQEKAPKGVAVLLSLTPYRAFGEIVGYFYPEQAMTPNIRQTARMHESAVVAPSVRIDDFVIIEEGARIGERVHLGPYVVVGRGVSIDDDTVIDAHVTLSFAKIGKHVRIKSGARIGQPGFGLHMDERGPFPIPQRGRVLIGDYVEIGANTTIDRGSQSDTIIGSGSRIDNLVQIAHNVKLGKNCIVVAQAGIAGSSELGNYVVVAGQAGVAEHLKIGDGVRIAGQSGVIRDIDSKIDVAGTPSMPVRDWHRQTAFLKRMIRS